MFYIPVSGDHSPSERCANRLGAGGISSVDISVRTIFFWSDQHIEYQALCIMHLRLVDPLGMGC